MKVIYGHVQSFYYYAINRVYVVTQFHNIIYTKYLSLINLFLLSHKISTPNITFQNICDFSISKIFFNNIAFVMHARELICQKLTYDQI